MLVPIVVRTVVGAILITCVVEVSRFVQMYRKRLN